MISGGGSNMKSIIKRSQKAQWLKRYQTQIGLVLSNDPLASGIDWAKGQGLSTAIVDHKNFLQEKNPRRAFEDALIHTLEPLAPDLIVLVGFMRILSPHFVTHYTNKMMNIHPSLLPAFTGLHTHQRAINAGVKFAGASVHWVSEVVDAGQIIDQAVVPILPGDTASGLASRVLTQEHLLYPRAIENWLKTQATSVVSG